MKKDTIYLRMYVKTNKVKYLLLVAVDEYTGSLFHYEGYIAKDVLEVFKKFYPSLTEEEFENIYKEIFSGILEKYGVEKSSTIFKVSKTKTQNKKFLRKIKRAIREFFAELQKKEKEKGLTEYLAQKEGLKDRDCKVIYDLGGE